MTLPGFGLKDPRKIVMLSERSRSLSRLPLPSESPPGGDGVGVTQTAPDVVGPANQGQEAGRGVGRGRRLDRLLQRQDSWSSFYTSKPDDDQNIDMSSVIVGKIRPDDSFSMLLRRHGGSRRNSLLRWCQRRTQGYKNIDITNFSTSWEDGLAFCAVYHTYLPTHIPYSTLSPDDKRENLDLAFRTGESVGVAATLTAEEMLSVGGPDWQRVLEYVESMFRHFEM
ncbi:cytospin-A-like [Sardina pilchardus]|uniref:cytospin-A-like n=1 Tax=Sardina pilchardus TaxID=27697 RepID=UPI002E117903